ncbi:MAG: hypothetical protein K0B11_08860 [Mariniphaga sp.]|nr:hypothetical protein [Mariniphaga sp.]
MRRQAIFTSVFQWLKKTEMFARPSKQLPGKWRLFEYYTEKSGELVNVKETQLKQQDIFWEIEFEEDGCFQQKSGLTIKFLEGIESSGWLVSKNFITLIYRDDASRNEEFQFAIVNDKLKLLKKDISGKIIFFGFFRRLN